MHACVCYVCVCVCWDVRVSMCECVGRVQGVCIESVQESKKRVNAGCLGSHLMAWEVEAVQAPVGHRFGALVPLAMR
jgi:hypothetical protein